MPNWVYNTVHVHADTKEQLDRFIRKTTKPHPEVSTLPKFDTPESDIVVIELSEGEFSFWNILRPKKKLWKEYFSVSGSNSNTPTNNWYSWNNAKWGTKWDASDVELDRHDDTYATVAFSTAWSPPLSIVHTIGKKFPELAFTWGWEEEQGFGGEWEIKGDDCDETDSYDIPASHAEFVERDRTCNCDWLDEEDWFDDCPRADGSHEPLIKIAPDQTPEQENK